MIVRIPTSRDLPTPVEEELARRGRRQAVVAGLIGLALLAWLSLKRAA